MGNLSHIDFEAVETLSDGEFLNKPGIYNVFISNAEAVSDDKGEYVDVTYQDLESGQTRRERYCTNHIDYSTADNQKTRVDIARSTLKSLSVWASIDQLEDTAQLIGKKYRLSVYTQKKDPTKTSSRPLALEDKKGIPVSSPTAPATTDGKAWSM